MCMLQDTDFPGGKPGSPAARAAVCEARSLYAMIYVYIYIYIYIYVFYVDMYIYICIYTHIHTYMWRRGEGRSLRGAFESDRSI